MHLLLSDSFHRAYEVFTLNAEQTICAQCVQLFTFYLVLNVRQFAIVRLLC